MDEYLGHVISEVPGSINSTLFLTLLMEKLNNTNTWNTFTCFSEVASHFAHEDHPKKATLLDSMVTSFPDEWLDNMYYKAPVDKKGKFNYTEFTPILKNGTKDKEDS